MADSEIKNMIESQVQNLVLEHIMSEETQKTNLEEQNLIDLEEAVSYLYIQASRNDGKPPSNLLKHLQI